MLLNDNFGFYPMLMLITGHILGMFLPLFVFKNIQVEASSFGENILVYLMILALLGFMEYQLFRSIKYGMIYFRGTVNEFEKSFKMTQFAYGVQGGFLLMVLLQHLFQ